MAKLPTVEELDQAVQSFPVGVPLHRGYDYIPRFKAYIWDKFESKLTVTAAIQCSDILTAQWAASYRLDAEKYQNFLDGLER